MKTLHNKTTPVPVIEQTKNNTTTWIGHHHADDNELISGQTFISPTEADLDSIEVFANSVIAPGSVHLTLHQFDTNLQNWGPVLASADENFSKKDNGHWKAFSLKGHHLQKGKSYGFRITSPNTFIGMGEAAGNYNTPPFAAGQEWKFSGDNQQVTCYSYFSLAFKIALRA